jgi:predicted HTH transcriptional regulator
MRISLKTALEGGISDPRNATLMKMFSLIGIGERAGSGIPSIISVWSDAMGVVPTYQQFFAPDRVQFVIDVNGTTADKPLKSNVAVPLSGELSGKMSEKMPEKTSEKILYLISENPRITTRELVDIIGIHERNVARNLKTLQERGFLRRIGGRKEGYWQVQI